MKRLLHLALVALVATSVGFGATAVAAKKNGVQTSVRATYKPGKQGDVYGERAGSVAGTVGAAKKRCTVRRKVIVLERKKKIGVDRTDRHGEFKVRVDASSKAKLRVKVKKMKFGTSPETVCKAAVAKAKTRRN
jgi:hypothetical protein